MQEQILCLTVERARSCPRRRGSSYGKRLLTAQNPGPVGVSGQVGHLTLTDQEKGGQQSSWPVPPPRRPSQFGGESPGPPRAS